MTAALSFGAAPAAAKEPCWRALFVDWADGRIDKTYPVHCYREALKHLPSDVSTYSSAHDDILRALQSAIAAEKKQHKTVGNDTPVPPQSGGSGDGGSGSGGGGTDTSPGGTDAGSGTTTTTTTSEPGRDNGGGLAGQVSSSSPSSVPTPLIILGGIALLLVAAGAAGLIAKRVQARRQAP